MNNLHGEEVSIKPSSQAMDASPKQTYKSYKKKFKKLRLQFEDVMRQSDDFCVQEQVAKATAYRLAHQNDNLLETLLEANSCFQIPADKRFDIETHLSDLTPIPSLITNEDLYESSQLYDPSLQAMCADIRRLIDERQSVRHPTDADRKPLSDLLQRVPHHSIKSGRVPDETMDTLKPLSDTAHPLAFLSYAELSDHLAAMDAILESDDLADTSMLNAVSTPSHESLSNPNNGYNWLCINEPKVFLPDGETERPAKAAIPREKGKRASMAATKPGEIPEVAAMAGVTVVEEDPSGPGNNPNSTKKRKRIEEGEDGNYHPKTGRLDDPKPRKRAYSRKKKADDGSTGDGTGTAGEGDTPKPKRIRARAKPKAKPAPVSDGVGPMVLGQDVPEQEYSLGQGQEPEPAPQQDVAHKPEQQLESGSHALNDSAMPGTPGATSQAGV